VLVIKPIISWIKKLIGINGQLMAALIGQQRPFTLQSFIIHKMLHREGGTAHHTSRDTNPN